MVEAKQIRQMQTWTGYVNALVLKTHEQNSKVKKDYNKYRLTINMVRTNHSVFSAVNH